MSPDDHRHGTNGGYLQHIFDRETACDECREAHNKARRNLWRKRYVRGVDRLYIDATGTHRRIRALMALGWRYRDIDRLAGHEGATRAAWAHNLMQQRRVHIDTAERVDDIYGQLCMTPGPSQRLRNLGLKNGWAPPLAWDDIDNDEAPDLGGSDDGLDVVVVDRLVAGNRIESTRAEKVEAMRRWLANGGSEREFCRLHGWREGRYVERPDSKEVA